MKFFIFIQLNIYIYIILQKEDFDIPNQATINEILNGSDDEEDGDESSVDNSERSQETTVSLTASEIHNQNMNSKPSAVSVRDLRRKTDRSSYQSSQMTSVTEGGTKVKRTKTVMFTTKRIVYTKYQPFEGNQYKLHIYILCFVFTNVYVHNLCS